MGQLIALPDRSPLITAKEWSEYVNLAHDIFEVEEILAAMKADFQRKKRNLLRALRAGARIENSGKIA